MTSGWQAVVLVAATYIYFLIFAQFGFLKRLDQLALSDSYLKAVMAAMAAGGILASLLSPRLLFRGRPVTRLRVSLIGCALAALASSAPLGPVLALAVSLLIGLSLGTLTVTLVSALPIWTGERAAIVKVALGTGLGYFVCNIPSLFTASPRAIAYTSAVICFGAAALRPPRPTFPHPNLQPLSAVPPFPLLVAWFGALVWLDSAAFLIIQSSPALKAGTWAGTVHLWRNAGLHLVAAIASGLLLARRGVVVTLLAAFTCLAGACLLLHDPVDLTLASVLYPIGVSLYSVALVVTPCFLLFRPSLDARKRSAGWLYAIAGWIASALGIGMAQHLHAVPVLFVVASGLLFAVPLVLSLGRRFPAQVAAVLATIALAWILSRTVLKGPPAPLHAPALTVVQYGRQVYISEGCIHCHSQYVRPHSEDTVLWGPAQDVEVIRREKPPLIGNRRQGPDLSEVGARRSPLWLRIHFWNPRAVSYDSIMPNYNFLFDGPRGEALIAYLESLRTLGSEAHIRDQMASWTPNVPSGASTAKRGQVLFARYCATCHSASGEVRQRWDADFKVLPPSLASDHLPYLADATSADAHVHRLESIIKFGLPGTDMPGHEYLPDADIVSLARYVQSLRPADRP